MWGLESLHICAWLTSALLCSLSQVLVLRELAVSAPTFFFQQVQPFFDNVFYAVWDSKQAIREGAVSALRACLILTTQRETKEMQKPQWYKVRAEALGGACSCPASLCGFHFDWLLFLLNETSFEH